MNFVSMNSNVIVKNDLAGFAFMSGNESNKGTKERKRKKERKKERGRKIKKEEINIQ